ncbi:recombinase family protein [Brevibacillus choshinensis]|uniref:recombinase family protein n=1 Tax=Brevibacillus choshinensis TaxID=54911 RepID=UPI002E1A9F0D|nr:recombinase family protein [Brevibacillus choshinensis]
MKNRYIYFLILVISLLAILMIGCSKATERKKVIESKKVPEVCKEQEECIQVGDELVQKVNENLKDISELEKLNPIEEHKEESNDKSKDEDSQFLLKSYHIDDEKIVDPYIEKIDQKRLEEVFKDDKKLQEQIPLLQKDSEYHEKIWNLYSTLIPVQYREQINKFEILTDGYDGTFAHVVQDADHLEKWTLSLDVLDWKEVHFNDWVETLIHETAHVLTLNDSQVPVDKKYFDAVMNEKDISEYRNKCKSLFLEEGCTKEDSYINQFHAKFWTDIEQDWLEKNVEKDSGAQVEFFEQHQDKFVSEYATTNVVEDIAETIPEFVLSDSKTVQDSQEIKYQKIAFFYQFPELVQMRAEVLSGLFEISKDKLSKDM